ncbi:hypothetical protein, partial [Streptomyces sp. NPDC059134]|uniref:hypothetical protein n=1 Tax=Streptomyces sp. NPDC059134 TaxID=3346738 RepID=UPI0036ACBAEB
MTATPTDRAEAVTERVLGWEPGHGLTVMAEGSGGPGGTVAAGGARPAADAGRDRDRRGGARAPPR